MKRCFGLHTVPIAAPGANTCDFAKSVPARLTAVEAPAYDESEQDIAGLQARIANTVAFLDGLSEAQFDNSETLEIVLRHGKKDYMGSYKKGAFSLSKNGHALNFVIHRNRFDRSNVMKIWKVLLATITVAAGMLTAPMLFAEGEMSFFVTSAGSGDGANLGGIEGADAHCRKLAAAAGAGTRNWVAYLSTQGENALNARDRIGMGPWYNARGVMVAENLAELHQDAININHETAIDENGAPVPYVQLDDNGVAIPPPEQPEPIEHDILTGSDADGMAFAVGEDRTCGNWTSNDDGSAMVGHHDRRSLEPGLSPWNAAHPSRGCSQENLVASAGSGRFYCMASD